MKTDDLIRDLSVSLKSVQPVSRLRLSLELLSIIAVSFTATVIYYGVPAAFTGKLDNPLMIAELTLNILLIVISACAAVTFSYPDQPGAQTLRPFLAIVFAGYSAVALLSAFQSPELIGDIASSAPHGLECLICILVFAILPTGWMIWRLRRLASTAPALLGGLILLTAAATGCLGVRIVETEIITTGLIVWHYLPLILLSGLGMASGTKIFRW